MRHALAAAALAALAACAGEETLSPRQEANRWALANTEPVGAPTPCIEIARIRNSIGRDGDVVDFWMLDGRILRNRLPRDCPGLAFEDRFLYRTAGERLCAGDQITIVEADGSRGATCTLGAFQEVRIAP